MEHELDRRLLLSAAGLAGVAALAASRAGAGPLNPPAGPVGPTGRTVESLADELAELRGSTPISAATTPGNAEAHFRITTPGSYHIPAGFGRHDVGKVIIDILPSNVTLDLNGHELSHNVPQAGAPPLIRVPSSGGNATNLRIHNGSLNSGSGGSSSYAVQFAGASRGVVLEDLRILNGRIAGAPGFNQNFRRVEVRRCHLSFTGAPAIELSGCTGAVVTGCVIATSGSGGTGAVGGIHVGPFGRVEDCQVIGELGRELIGIRVGPSSAVIGCTVSDIGINFGSTPDNAAIYTADNCRVERNTISSSTRAIALGTNSSACDNVITVGVNTGIGIFCIGGRCTIMRNHISGQNVGIHCGSAGSLRSNLVMHNTLAQNTAGILANLTPSNLIGTFLNISNQTSQVNPWCNIYLG